MWSSCLNLYLMYTWSWENAKKPYSKSFSAGPRIFLFPEKPTFKIPVWKGNSEQEEPPTGMSIVKFPFIYYHLSIYLFKRRIRRKTWICGGQGFSKEWNLYWKGIDIHLKGCYIFQGPKPTLKISLDSYLNS